MNIAILGCGYLGRELLKSLASKNNFVTATTKNPSSLKKISELAQACKVVNAGDEEEIYLLVKENDLIIVTIFSEDISEIENAYLKAAQNIKKAVMKINQKKRIIFISQSLIYGDHFGKWVDEDASLNSKDDLSKILIDAEQTYLSLKKYNCDVTILRAARMYGAKRELINLAKNMRNNILKGNSSYYINMVHVSDVVNAINFVIQNNILGVFNIVDDEHLTRKELLDKICKKLNISKISFDETKNIFDDTNKRVSNYRIKEKGFVFQYPMKNL
jgi:nucleoside-diphosphate-sugar epimerase